MRILILEIANGIANQSQVHDQHKPAKRYQCHLQYRGWPPEAAATVFSILLVSLDRLVWVMDLALMDY